MSEAAVDAPVGEAQGAGRGLRVVGIVAVVVLGLVVLGYFGGLGWSGIGPHHVDAEDVAPGIVWRGIDRDVVIDVPSAGVLSIDVRSDQLLRAERRSAPAGDVGPDVVGAGFQRFETEVDAGRVRLHLTLAEATPLARFEVRTAFREEPATLEAGHRAGLVLRPGEEDRYALEVTGTGWLRLHSTGAVDLHAELRDASGAVLATDDDGGAGGNFTLAARVAPGSHTVVVRGAGEGVKGTYGLALALVDRQPLTIRTRPADAEITIMNGGEGFENGALLEPGELTISVSAPGFRAELLQITHTPYEPSSPPLVVLRDDHGNAADEATRAMVGNTFTGVLHDSDTDWFEFTAPEAGTYRFVGSGGTDTFGRLIDPAGEELATNDDGGEGLNFRLQRNLDPDETVYLEVSGYGTATGTYAFDLLLAPPDQPDEIGDDVPSIAAGTSIGGDLEDNDRDLFRVTLDGPTRLEVFTTSDLDTLGRVLDASGVQLARDDDGGEGADFLIRTSVYEAGDVFVEVAGFGDDENGSYTLSVQASELVPDDHADVAAAATTVTLVDGRGSATGVLEPGDKDVFRVVLDEPAVLEAGAQSGMDTVGRLRDADGNEIAYNDDAVGSDFLLSRTVRSPGEVFIEVTGYSDNQSGSYTLTVTTAPVAPDDHGDTLETATVVEGDVTETTVAGELVEDDVDMIRFHVAEPALVQLSTESSLDTVGRLLAADGTEIGYNDDGGNGANFLVTATVEAAGDYYARISGYGDDENGPYTLSIVVSQPEPDDHGDDAASATELLPGASVAGRLGPDDVDFFRIPVAEPMALRLTLDSTISMTGRFVDAGGNQLQYSAFSGDTSGETGISLSAPGDAYVQITGGGGVGDYTLTIASSAYVADDHADSRAGATELAAGATIAAQLRPWDRDVFRIVPARNGLLVLESRSSLDTVGRVVDAAGTQLGYNDDGGDGANFLIEVQVSAGEPVFLEVRGFGSDDTGPYDIVTQFSGG